MEITSREVTREVIKRTLEDEDRYLIAGDIDLFMRYYKPYIRELLLSGEKVEIAGVGRFDVKTYAPVKTGFLKHESEEEFKSRQSYSRLVFRPYDTFKLELKERTLGKPYASRPKGNMNANNKLREDIAERLKRGYYISLEKRLKGSHAEEALVEVQKADEEELEGNK